MTSNENKINNGLDYFAEQANQGWLDLGRKFLWTAEKLSFSEEGKKFVKEKYDNIVATQLEKQKLLDDYTNSKGMAGSVALNLTGGLFRQSSDPTAVVLNYVTNGALANVVGNAAEYAWEEASLYGRNIFTEWDNEKDIMGLAPGAVMGFAAGKLGNKYKVDNAPLYEEIKTKGTVENIAPLDKMVEESKKLDPDAASKVISEGNGIISLKDAAEVVKRQEWGQPQANYSNNTMQDWHNYLDYATNLDKDFKHEVGKTTVFEGKSVIKKGTSSIQIEKELDVAVQPLLKNMNKHLEQIVSEDAAELFGSTGAIKPFGNQLWDLSNSFSKKDFAEMIQGKIEVTGPDGKTRVQNILKNKINEYIGIKAVLDEAPEIKYAHYTDLLYNKNEAMTYVHNLIAEKDFDGIKRMGEFVGKTVELSQEEVDGIMASMIEIGKRNGIELTSSITKAGTYSIDDYPLEMATGFWHAINATTKDAQKKVGTYSGKSKWDVGRQWGNLPGDIPGDYDPSKVRFGNYAKIFEGFERNPYEVITEVYSTVAQKKAGVEDLKSWIRDITADDSGFEATSSIYGNRVKGLDGKVRGYMKKQLQSMDDLLETEGRYKPNFNLDPNDPRLTSKHARKSFKNFLNWKFLYGLNYIKEMPMNAYKMNAGARALGWETGNMRYLKDTFIEPIKMHYELARHWDKVKSNQLDKISDPKVRRRMEIFLERRVANDTIWNDTNGMLNVLQRTSHTLGDIGGFGQGLSDVDRIFISEWGAKNYMQDIFPNQKKLSPRLQAVLESNGVRGDALDLIKNRLKNISEDEFNELIFGGKRAKADVDVKIQNLFEQFSDIMGREFNAFEKLEVQAGDSFAKDMMMLYKRYSLGAFDNAKNALFNYYGEDGRLRKRFDLNDSFTENMKRTFKGVNHNQLFVLGQRGVYTYLLANAVQWTTGKLYGTGQNFKVEAKLEALTEGGDALPYLWEATSDLFADGTGAGILFGASTPFGGLIESIQQRANRANSTLKNDPVENWLWFVNTVITPEHIARGIDNIKFDKSVPSRLSSASAEADILWRTKYKTQARIQQIDNALPVENVLSAAVDWGAYFAENVTAAFNITGAPKDTPEDTVVKGATAMVQILEMKAESEAIIEIMSEDKEINEREADLKRLGLDIDSQLSKLDKIDRRTLNAVLAFKQIRDPEEILIITHNLVKSNKRKEFLRSLIPDEELELYRSYAKQVTATRENVNKLVKQRKKSGIEGYIESLDIADKYIRN